MCAHSSHTDNVKLQKQCSCQYFPMNMTHRAFVVFLRWKHCNDGPTQRKLTFDGGLPFSFSALEFGLHVEWRQWRNAAPSCDASVDGYLCCCIKPGSLLTTSRQYLRNQDSRFQVFCGWRATYFIPNNCHAKTDLEGIEYDRKLKTKSIQR